MRGNNSKKTTPPCIGDDYRHLKFRKATLSDLKVGMMVQYVNNERNPNNLKWEYYEVDERLIICLARNPKALDFVRIPVNN